MKNAKIYILMIGLAVLLAGCGLKFKNNKDIPDITPISLSGIATTTIIVEGKNWILYKDYENGFQIQYPQKWKIYKNSFSNQVLHIALVSKNIKYQNTDSVGIYVSVYNESANNLKNWIEGNKEKIGDFFDDTSSDGAIRTKERKEMIFLGKKCFYREFSAIEGGINKEYIFNIENRIYDIITVSRVGENHLNLRVEYEQELESVFNSIEIFQ